MDDIVKVKEYGDYHTAWFADGTKKTYAYEPEAVADFKDWCNEKGTIYLVGQAVEYSRDPNFRTF